MKRPREPFGKPPRRPFLASLLAIAVAVVAVVAVAGAPRGAEADPAIDAEEQAFLGIINSYRAQNGLGTLSLNTELNNAGDWMSNDMAAKDYFSHTDSLGRDPFQRMADFGYTYNTWKGENLAAGVETAQGAFDLFKNSPGHNMSEDPGELQASQAVLPAEAEALIEALRAWEPPTLEGLKREESKVLDSLDLDQLKALGYLE